MAPPATPSQCEKSRNVPGLTGFALSVLGLCGLGLALLGYGAPGDLCWVSLGLALAGAGVSIAGLFRAPKTFAVLGLVLAGLPLAGALLFAILAWVLIALGWRGF